MKKILYSILIFEIGLFFCIFVMFNKISPWPESASVLNMAFLHKESSKPLNILEIKDGQEVSIESEELKVSDEVKLPKEVLIDVPFTVQAPFGEWSEKAEESCEEACILMIHHFLEKTLLTPSIAQKELDELIDFQIKKYGDYKHSNASQIAKLAEDFYGYKGEVIYNFSIDDIKEELAKGNPVIIPAAGQLLGNPYFTPPGPVYHNLVLRGYNKTQFITNDPGTKRGEGYKYSYDVLYNAIHDWKGSKQTITSGQRAMIIMKR